MRRRDGRRLPERCWIADRTTSAKRSISVWTAATGMSVCACGAAHRCPGWYDGKPLHHDHPPRVGIFPRARERLTFDVPAGLADPHVIPPHDQHDADPVVLAAIAAVRPIKLAAVMVPIIERDGRHRAGALGCVWHGRRLCLHDSPQGRRAHQTGSPARSRPGRLTIGTKETVWPVGATYRRRIGKGGTAPWP